MPGDIEVQDTPAIMGNDEEAIQKAKGDGRHCEEIHRSNRFAVVMQKVRQRCAASLSLGARLIQRETVRSETSKPSIKSSP